MSPLAGLTALQTLVGTRRRSATCRRWRASPPCKPSPGKGRRSATRRRWRAYRLDLSSGRDGAERRVAAGSPHRPAEPVPLERRHRTMSDVSPLAGLTALQDLSLKGCGQRRVAAGGPHRPASPRLGGDAGERRVAAGGPHRPGRLLLKGTPVTDVSPLDRIPGLTILEFQSNPPADGRRRGRDGSQVRPDLTSVV